MADEFLTDQQQAEVVRNWVRQNGLYLVGGLLLGLGGLFGWNQYQDYRERQFEQAAALYDQLLEAVAESRSDDAASIVGELEESYSSSPYPDQARLALAKLRMDQSRFDDAAIYLDQVATGGRSAEIRHIAALRLARVRLHQQRFDAALAALDGMDPNSAFAPRSEEVRGDIYAAMGRNDEARTAYTAALASSLPGVIDRSFVQAKLNSLPLPEKPQAEPAGTPEDDTAAAAPGESAGERPAE